MNQQERLREWQAKKKEEDEFDWEEMLSEIHQKRQENNKIQFQKMDSLFSDL